MTTGHRLRRTSASKTCRNPSENEWCQSDVGRCSRRCSMLPRRTNTYGTPFFNPMMTYVEETFDASFYGYCNGDLLFHSSIIRVLHTLDKLIQDGVLQSKVCIKWRGDKANVRQRGAAAISTHRSQFRLAIDIFGGTSRQLRRSDQHAPRGNRRPGQRARAGWNEGDALPNGRRGGRSIPIPIAMSMPMQHATYPHRMSPVACCLNNRRIRCPSHQGV